MQNCLLTWRDVANAICRPLASTLFMLMVIDWKSSILTVCLFNCPHINNIVLIQIIVLEHYLYTFLSQVGNFNICASLLQFAQERTENRCFSIREFALAVSIPLVGTERQLYLFNLPFKYVGYVQFLFLATRQNKKICSGRINWKEKQDQLNMQNIQLTPDIEFNSVYLYRVESQQM